MTTVADAVSEDVADVLGALDLWISLHTADPGKTGASECTAVGRVQILAADGYSAFAAHVATGGRRKANDSLLEFGEAVADETLTHGGVWSASVAGTFYGGAPLVTPVAVAIGNPVEIPIGNFGIVGAGIP